MQSQLIKALCESLLKDGLISGDTITNMQRFQSLADDLINCVLSAKCLDSRNLNGIKKGLGKLISSKARVLKVDDATVKMIKSLLYDKVNVIFYLLRNKSQLRLLLEGSKWGKIDRFILMKKKM